MEEHGQDALQGSNCGNGKDSGKDSHPKDCRDSSRKAEDFTAQKINKTDPDHAERTEEGCCKPFVPKQFSGGGDG